MTKVTLRKLKTKRYALMTKAGVIYYKNEHGEIYTEKDVDKFRESHPNIDIVEAGGGYQGCVDIEKCSENGQEYISLIPYRYLGACYRVSDYKITPPEKLVRAGLWSKYSYNQFTQNISFECRVYKDRKILLLLSIDIVEDNEIVDTKTYTLKKPSGELWNLIYFFANQRTLPLRLEPSEDDKIYVIENYEDIKESSYFRETQKGHTLCKITSGYRILGYVNDQYSKIQYNMSPSSTQQFFSEQIVKLFEDFFELKNKDFGINKYFVRDSINSMEDLFVYMTTKDASKASKKQRSTYGFSDMDLINEIYNDIEKNSKFFNIISKRTTWRDPNEDYYKYDVVVNRINVFGEDIIYICQDPTCCYGRWIKRHANLLVIFLQGKFSKRLFKVYTGVDGNPYKVINFKKIIPTFWTIINSTIPAQRYYTDDRKTTYKKFIYFKPLKEIYSGTLIEKIINNISPEILARPLIPLTHWQYDRDYGRGELKHFINYNNMTESSVAILLKNTSPIAEQLLNNNLNNILFLFLSEIMQERPHSKMFTDTLSEADTHINIKVNPKATGLKKYFNMSMEQLNMLDDMLGEIFEAQLVNNFSLYYCHFNLFKVSNFINLDKYSSLNTETFDKLLNTSNSARFTQFYEAEKGELKALLTPFIQNYKLEQKINIIQELKDSLQEIKDYLNIRRKMIKLQETCPDKKIFTKQDEKRYVEFPTSGKIFIHFFRETEYNQRTLWYIGQTGNTPEQHFTARINSVYSPISMRHVYNDDNELLGVEVDLSRKYMIQFLHDELSKIYSVYVDANKNKLFKEALKRVENLCFVDEEMGLEIVTPKDINDLKSEGATLSHCVASYVDPICEGSENILFIRRIDMPYSPYFTMDLVYPENDYTKPGQVRQIHCYRNGDPTEEGIQKAFFDSNYPVYNKYYDILAFVRKWAEKMNGKLNKNTINAHYGALCAKRS